MPTQDISRYLNQPAKHYSTVQMQQGRVILDSDWNERAMAEAEDLRATLLDITCSRGTPNDGYAIHTVVDDVVNVHEGEGLVTHNTYNFTLKGGSFYLGGLRVEIEDGTTFLGQPDWLQINSDADNVPERVVAVVGVEEADRYDLVYLRVWEQPVSAVEDSELREVALGGRDTSVRIRRMQRIEVKSGLTNLTPSNCGTSFAELVSELENGAVFNEETGELVSNATLTVSPSLVGASEDPCSTPIGGAGGYVGAHNQAIRIELRGDNTLIWGYDNASPLYRVSVDSETELTFLTEPADLPAFPRAGQIVEVLQWGARLSNKEKVAERQGELRRVATTYDPETKKITVSTGIPGEWIDWLEDANNNDGEPQFLFLRVWDQGDTLVDTDDPLVLDYHTLDPEETFDLGTTGLAVKIPIATGRPGDYWIIGARPSTPELVTPWELLDQAPPHGPREFFAPLGIIFFDEDTASLITPHVIDCRPKLRPLCEGGCCKVTVGDGKHSFGQVSTLQEAITMLEGVGGKICVLPGEHLGTALVDGLAGANNIIIEGCGPRSVLKNVPPSTPTEGVTDNFAVFYDPVLHIRDAEYVQVRDLRVDGHSAIGILIEQTAEENVCKEILVDNVQAFATGRVDVPNGVLELAASCVVVRGARQVDIVDSEFGCDNVVSLCSAITLGGDELRLHRSRVIASEYNGVDLGAAGGVQIRSASHDIEIIGCEIRGGWGHGIALGHAGLFPRESARGEGGEELERWYVQSQPAGTEFFVNPALKWDCLEIDLDGNATSSDEEYVWLPCGPVEQIRIYDNVIHKMGLSGISTTTFFSPAYEWETSNPRPVFIVAIDIDIARNLIEDNVRIPWIPEVFSYLFDRCVGGICLAASIGATIRENQILRNGTALSRVPICGVGLVAAQAATIEDNRIVGNGAQLAPFTENPAGPVPNIVFRGLRGGIAVWEVTPTLGYTFKTSVSTGPLMPSPLTNLDDRGGESALVVRGNEVSQPLGKALWVRRGFGSIAVTGNSLESFGDPVEGVWLVGVGLRWTFGSALPGALLDRPARGACVEVVNLGLALDVDWLSESDPLPMPEWVWDNPSESIIGGSVLYANNSMHLDWNIPGGHACSVVVSSLGSVVYNSNVNTVVTHNAFGSTFAIPAGQEGAPIKSLLENVVTGYQFMSFVMAATYVGAASAAQACGNRSEEGKFDALFSLVVGPALAPHYSGPTEVKNAVMAAGNIGTHCTVVDSTSGETVNNYNVAVFPHEDEQCGFAVTAGSLGEFRMVTIS